MLDAGNSNAGGGFAIDDDAVRRGLGAVYWPGRLQRLKHGPLVESLSPNWELWLDGAHNDSCGEVLSVQAQSWCDRPLDLVFGMLESKVPQELLQPLAPHVGRLRAVAIPDEPGSLSAAAAAAAAREAGIADSRPLSSVAEAVAALSQKGRAGRILICGSLYLAGAVLADNG
jgi:dihydrofolate synthase/folylpolyglutamate synthase